MFRAVTLVRLAAPRLPGACLPANSLLLAKRSGTLPNSTGVDLEKPAAVDSTATRLPSWVRNNIDKEIYLAKHPTELLSPLDNKKLSPDNAVFLINTLGQWVNEGKWKPEDIIKPKQWSTIEALIQKGNFRVKIPQMIRAIKNLVTLGCDPKSKTIESLEMDIMWQLRKSNLLQHFQVLEFQSQFQHTDVQKRVMQETVCDIERRWIELSEPREFISILQHLEHFDPRFIDKAENRMLDLVEVFSKEHRVKLLVALSASKRRPTPLLRALCFHMNKDIVPLTLRESIDILFALKRLSFHDQCLMERICNDLALQPASALSSQMVGSVMTSLGQLKYRHEGLMQMLCDWMDKDLELCRYQDVVSAVLCLGSVYFVPVNWESLSAKILEYFRRCEMPNAIRLDVVWSLAVLNQVEPNFMRSVLNSDFLGLAPGLAEGKQFSPVAKTKLNQLWCLAKLEKIVLQQGMSTAMPLTLVDTASESPSPLSTSALEALTSLAPAPKYLKIRSRTAQGIDVDGEFIINSNGVPVLLPNDDVGSASLVPSGHFRIAVLVLDYKDLCIGSSQPIGLQVLRERLLTQMGYTVVKVLHSEFSVKEKLLKQVQFLEQLIKKATSS